MRTLLPLSALLSLALVACGDKDADDTGTDGSTDTDTDGGTELVDADDDGFPEDIDCDDTDPAVNPGASEICDGVDNDCDDLIDDEDLDLQLASATLWFEDADDDGYGSAGGYQVACEQPTGFADNAGDCNDGDASVSPDATEVCDEIDNDCSGLVDDDATDALTWYVDSDEDGYGVDDDTALSCDQPFGYSAEPGDCEDTEPTVNPGSFEICNDGLDNDCDDSFDACEMLAGGADITVFGAASYDESGVAIAGVGDVDGDGNDDFMVGARGYDGADTDAGGAFLHYGPVESLGEITVDDMDVALLGEFANDKSGRDLAAGDLDGDGVVDIVTSGPGNDNGGNATGTVYVVSGASLPESGESMSLTDATTTYWGETNFDYLGVHVAVHDVSGDGQADLLAGATGDDQGPDNSGAIYMFAGPIASGDNDLSSGGWTTKWTGEGNGDSVGLNFDARGDLDDDGITDVLVGVGNNDSAAVEGGAFYVVSGADTGTVALADGLLAVYGDEANANLGSAVTWLGDWDGDGYDDFAVGQAAANTDAGEDAGQVFLVRGAASFDTTDLTIEDLAFATVSGEEDQDQLGGSLAGLGDHDGDGNGDLLIGAVNGGDDAVGAAYLFYGPIEGALAATDADSRFYGDNEEDHLGYRVGFAGDVSGLGTDALFLGGIDVDGETVDVGAAYLIFELGL